MKNDITRHDVMNRKMNRERMNRERMNRERKMEVRRNSAPCSAARKRIAVVFGGRSSEYEISLQSAREILSQFQPGSLLETKFEVIPIGITRDGLWLRYYGHMTDLLAGLQDNTWFQHPSCVPVILSPNYAACRDSDGCHREANVNSQGEASVNSPSGGASSPCAGTAAHPPGGLLTFFPDGPYDVTQLDMALPILHGRNGEDGRLQGLIELAGIQLIGCGCLSSALCMDKHRAHLIAAAAGVSVPAAITVRGDVACNRDALLTLTATLNYPLFVKPVNEGSSHGISRITSPQQLPAAVALALKFDDEVIIEESVDGFEVGCAIVEDSTGGLICGRVDELELNGTYGESGFLDYHLKYEMPHSGHNTPVRIHTPARIDPVTDAMIMETARIIYRALDCSGFARVDMFLTPNHEIVFNEVNSIPGLTQCSRFPKMLEAAGISFEEMLERLLV